MRARAIVARVAGPSSTRVPPRPGGGRCCGSWAHWRSVRPTRVPVCALLTSVLLYGCRSSIWDQQCGLTGVSSADIGGGPRVIIRPRCPAARLDLAAHTAHTVPILYGHETASLVGRVGRPAQVLRAGVGAIDADWPGASIGDGAGCSRRLRGTGRDTLFCCPYYPYKMKKVTQSNASRNEPSQNVWTVRAVWADWCHSTPSLTRNSSHRSTVSGDGRNRRGSA